jgi:hypothetical protein
MIDWYMLLAPLVVLPIVLLFGFVGCAEGSTIEDPLFGTARTLKLNFHIVKSNPAVTKITAKFTFHPSGGVDKVFTPAPVPINSLQDDVSDTLDPVKVDNGGKPFTCSCQVDVEPAELMPQQFTSAPETADSVTFHLYADVGSKSFDLWSEN